MSKETAAILQSQKRENERPGLVAPKLGGMSRISPPGLERGREGDTAMLRMDRPEISDESGLDWIGIRVTSSAPF